jgi:TPR repeat protein
MYLNGQSVLLDLMRAHMWFNIAAISGDVQSVENRNKVERQLSQQQIEQAQRMARECMASNFKKCD